MEEARKGGQSGHPRVLVLTSRVPALLSPYPGIMFKTDVGKVLPARLLRKPEGKSCCSASVSHHAVNFSTWLHRSLFQ